MTNDNKPKVSGQRRRRTTDDGDRERASASQRQRPSQSSQPRTTGGSSGSSRSSSSQGSSALINIIISLIRNSKRPGLTIAILAVIGICVITVYMSGDGLPITDDPGLPAVTYPTEAPATDVPTINPSATPDSVNPDPTSTAVVDVEGQSWLIMLYQDADDQILEQDIYLDLNEAEKVGSSSRVEIVAQVDRYSDGYSGDGDWDSTKRYYITEDPDLNVVRSRQIADLGEASMSDGQTLVDFVQWAAETYPADKYVLIMSDHGMGWPGGWSDPDPKTAGPSDIPLADYLGDELYLREIDAALQQIRDETSIDQFELIGMDACLMGHLEVYAMLAPHARYAVASQETEPAVGWAYTSFLGDLKNNPDMDGRTLGELIVESYIDEDQRLVDDQARMEMLNKGRPLGGLFGYASVSAAQVAAQMEPNTTLAVIDLSEIPNVMTALNTFVNNLQSENQRDIAEARTYAQSFTSVFGTKVPPSYIDLGHFTSLVSNQRVSSATSNAAQNLLATINNAVIAERHGSKKPGATGLSIYFPTSQLYSSPAAGPQSYTVVAQRFAEASLWDDFLTYHYTGQEFDFDARTISIPDASAAIRGPGAFTSLETSPLVLSSSTVSPGESVLMASDIAGDNIGYIYLFVGYVDQFAASIQLIDADYIENVDTREVSGVYYPVWPDTGFTLDFEWEPIVFAINDGTKSVIARFKPESYGETFEQATYSVEGTYTFAQTGEQRYARLYFSDGKLTSVYGYTGSDETGAPREITPELGDTFTVLDTWWDLDAEGNVAATATQAAGTLTFGEDPWTWENMYAAPGVYIIGYIIEDMDGNQIPVYASVTVK